MMVELRLEAPRMWIWCFTTLGTNHSWSIARSLSNLTLLPLFFFSGFLPSLTHKESRGWIGAMFSRDVQRLLPCFTFKARVKKTEGAHKVGPHPCATPIWHVSLLTRSIYSPQYPLMRRIPNISPPPTQEGGTIMPATSLDTCTSLFLSLWSLYLYYFCPYQFSQVATTWNSSLLKSKGYRTSMCLVQEWRLEFQCRYLLTCHLF